MIFHSIKDYKYCVGICSIHFRLKQVSQLKWYYGIFVKT